MTVTVDTSAKTIVVDREGRRETVPLYSTEGFELLSELWLKVGWNQKHVYTFTWLGRPVIQLPEDLIRIQEVVHELRPDVIVECGVAHGGSLVFYASLCKLLDHGRVVGVDVDIRPRNRAALEAHPLAEWITLVEADSVAPATVERVAAEVEGAERTLIVLDSNHSKEHVRAELEAYAPLVSVGSYVVVMDGIMQLVADTPRGETGWVSDNPLVAAEEFVAAHPESFAFEDPPWRFNESELRTGVTHAPRGVLRRIA